MGKASSEFEEDERAPRVVLQGSLDDAKDQLRRAEERLVRAQRRVRNLELAVQSWTALLEEYDRSSRPNELDRVHVQL